MFAIVLNSAASTRYDSDVINIVIAGVIQFCLTLVNILCIWLFPVFAFWLKELDPCTLVRQGLGTGQRNVKDNLNLPSSMLSSTSKPTTKQTVWVFLPERIASEGLFNVVESLRRRRLIVGE